MAKRPVPLYDFKAFGAAIKAARNEYGESRKKVSDELYISPRYLANIENKGQQPSLQVFYDLVTRYHISVDQFFFPNSNAEKSTGRRQLDALLDGMSDKGIRIVTATAREITEVEKAEDKGGAEMENRKRNIQMKFYVTEEEKRLIDEKMKQLPIKQYGAYFRKMAIDGYILVVDRSDTKAYIRELQAVSRNINQIAKRANATGTVYRQDIEDIKKAVDEIWRLQRRTLLNQP